MKNSRPSVQILLRDSYLAVIKGSLGSKMFRHLYAKVDGKRKDIAQGGRLSCGIFVSWILNHFKLINGPHATVEGAIEDMKESGWKKIRKPRIGAVIVWEPIHFGKTEHRHIGFYMGDGRAISNSTVKRVPVSHLWRQTSSSPRRVEGVYWHSKLK